MMTYDEAQAETARLEAQHTSLQQQQAQLTAALAQGQADAADALLDGKNGMRATVAHVTRLEQERTITDMAMTTLVGRIEASKQQEELARIADQRQQAVTLFQQAAAVRAEIQPHLDAIKAIEGYAPAPEHGRSHNFVNDALRLIRGAEYLEDRLPQAARDALFAQRAHAPTDVDKAVYRWMNPTHTLPETWPQHEEVPA